MADEGGYFSFWDMIITWVLLIALLVAGLLIYRWVAT